MGFSQLVDWSEDWENWENHGRNALEEACKHKTQDSGEETNMRYSGYCDECGEGEDSARPMMNYAYPLHTEPSEEKILKVVQKTCCTVMQNNETGQYFLALCGGGMDLSQDIAYAYMLAEKRIPYELAISVCTQPGLSKGGIEFRRIMRECKAEIGYARDNAERQIKEMDEAVKKSLKEDKERAEERAKNKGAV